MTYLTNLIYQRLIRLDVTSPIVYLDFFIALSIITAVLFYLRRFPVFRVIIGIIFLFGCSVLFFLSGFIFTSLVFGFASGLVGFSLPLIFAPEIRHYLEKIGRFSYIKLPSFSEKQKKKDFIRNLVEAVYELAERNIGGTIVVARKTGLGQTIETGVIIDAKFGSKILQNLFFPKSPLHDGAIVIKDARILAAGCLLPISTEVKLDSPFGTRHKSGLSITKDTDAVVILVSEQRGEVSLAENGKLEVNLDRAELSSRLTDLLC